MIATTRRMAMTDFLLIATAAIVIVLSHGPTATPRQRVEIRDRSGNLQRYSLETSDPRLAMLRKQLAEQERRAPDRALAVARWRAELAEFYADRTADDSSETSALAPVSFIDRVPEAIAPTESAETIARNSEHVHWVQAANEARRAIAEAQQRLSLRSSLASQPSIVLGEIIANPVDRVTLAAAAVIGFCTALVFACWTYACPRIGLQVPSTSATPEFTAESGDCKGKHLRLVLPEAWVHVTQPVSVQLRRGAFAAVVITALACIVL